MDEWPLDPNRTPIGKVLDGVEDITTWGCTKRETPPLSQISQSNEPCHQHGTKFRHSALIPSNHPSMLMQRRGIMKDRGVQPSTSNCVSSWVLWQKRTSIQNLPHYENKKMDRKSTAKTGQKLDTTDAIKGYEWEFPLVPHPSFVKKSTSKFKVAADFRRRPFSSCVVAWLAPACACMCIVCVRMHPYHHLYSPLSKAEHQKRKKTKQRSVCKKDPAPHITGKRIP